MYEASGERGESHARQERDTNNEDLNTFSQSTCMPHLFELKFAESTSRTPVNLSAHVHVRCWTLDSGLCTYHTSLRCQRLLEGPCMKISSHLSGSKLKGVSWPMEGSNVVSEVRSGRMKGKKVDRQRWLRSPRVERESSGMQNWIFLERRTIASRGRRIAFRHL